MGLWLAGLSVMMGLIIAIGAQNVWVLSMSVRRHHPWIIAITCMLIDGVLMAIGVMAFQQIQRVLPNVQFWLTLLGIILLAWLAVQAVIRVIRGSSGLLVEQQSQMSWQKAVTTTLILSLVNPHVYLDTVVLIGSLATASASPWMFYSGAITASALWFLGLVALGRPLRVWLSSPVRWRIFDGVIAALLSWVALSMFRLI